MTHHTWGYFHRGRGGSRAAVWGSVCCHRAYLARSPAQERIYVDKLRSAILATHVPLYLVLLLGFFVLLVSNYGNLRQVRKQSRVPIVKYELTLFHKHLHFSSFHHRTEVRGDRCLWLRIGKILPPWRQDSREFTERHKETA